ncbi:hypothetical protein SESBI_20400 [Sesbania bispinosa]|nr:hypothetical protein SESBI_20400 [Sesbania bispinosa]
MGYGKAPSPERVSDGGWGSGCWGRGVEREVRRGWGGEGEREWGVEGWGAAGGGERKGVGGHGVGKVGSMGKGRGANSKKGFAFDVLERAAPRSGPNLQNNFPPHKFIKFGI